MNRGQRRHEAFRALAAELDRIDVDVYQKAGKDPLEPVLGAGEANCRVCIFGRDPGRFEVVHGQPFVGAGGQKIRQVLYEQVHGEPLPSFEASLEVGRTAFWANTVPYKPIGNKVWSAKTRKAFRPHVVDLLVHEWQGTDVLAMGREAFFWFAADREEKKRFKAHWEREDRFGTGLEVELVAEDGRRTVTVYPLPHPSPLNATWAPHVHRLIRERLVALGFGPDTWAL